MHKQNISKDKKNDTQNINEEVTNTQETTIQDETCECDQETCSLTEEEINGLQAQLNDKSKQCDEYMKLLQRTMAEFDNYKKRTLKEKEMLYSDASSEVVAAFLPVVDNMERALQASTSEDTQSLKEGIEMVFKQLKEVMKSLGVVEIKCEGEKFDPMLHNAVMHIEDESYEEGIVVEEFQKGYILKDKVIRHSMVKVAN